MRYEWKRFWIPRGNTITLTEDGYLPDPESEWEKFSSAHLHPFEAIANNPCLVFLGEPGIGKTDSMNSEVSRVRETSLSLGDQVFSADLRQYGTDDRLVQDLFESTDFHHWLKGSHRLHMFLDGLDECLLRIDNVSVLLIKQLEKCPTHRLFLRIACRTADWPSTLETGLKEVWGTENVGEFELAPLRRKDVKLAATTSGLYSDEFVAQIAYVGAAPFAIKPITLHFLMNTYASSGRLPTKQVDLYSEGCRLLCEETSDTRRDAKRVGLLSADQRLAVASRIAAVTVLTNKYAVWTGVDSANIPPEDVAVRELAQGHETAAGATFEVTESAIRETLDTGLFSSRGSRRLGWAHQTYSEFLAARYLTSRNMSYPQIMTLITHAGDPETKLVPQLHEAAVWLSSMDHAMFRSILRTEPEVVLRSDIANRSTQDREDLTAAILSGFEERRLVPVWWGMRPHFRKLAHPNLANQLRPYLINSEKEPFARQASIEILAACEDRDLQAELARIALDAAEPPQLRAEAAYAINQVGDNHTKASLKPLIYGQGDDDPHQELKGCALRAVWPEHMSIEELLPALSPPEPSFFGAYSFFLTRILPDTIPIDDLPAAVEWVEKQPHRGGLGHSLGDVIDAIMWTAWKHLDAPGVLQPFARAAASRRRHHDEIVGGDRQEEFRKALTTDEEKRRRLLLAMLKILDHSPRESLLMAYGPTAIVSDKDFPWMLQQLEKEGTPQRRQVWAELLWAAFDWRQPDQMEMLLHACEEVPELASRFHLLRGPILLGSPEAEQMKKTHLAFSELHEHKPRFGPTPKERMAESLDECETGNSYAFWRLTIEMTLGPDDMTHGKEAETHLTVLPGWEAADATTRARIIAAARRYLNEQEPHAQEWLGTNIFHLPAAAGYKALILLLTEAPHFLNELPPEVWKKWASIILAYPTSIGMAGEEVHQEMVARAYRQAPDEIISTLSTIIDKENRDTGHIFIVRKLEKCWDHRLRGALLEKAKDKNLKPKCVGHLLNALLDQNDEDAQIFLQELIQTPSSCESEIRELAIVATKILLDHADNATWSLLWPLFEADTAFGRQVVEQHVSGYPRQKVGHRLSEQQLAAFYLWMVRQYPYGEDPKLNGFVGTRGHISEFRDSMLFQLKARGTFQACEQIQRIAQELPQYEWLRWHVQEALANARRSTWVPPLPKDILELTLNRDTRLVQNGDQLLDALVDSLRRIEEKLQGETPVAHILWNESSKGRFRPRDEPSVSDILKWQLEEDLAGRGIVANREVEIRRGTGAGAGEVTDIHVTAVTKTEHGELYEAVRAIIEVKGCWNKQLDQAMQTQLVDRYLKDNQCRHGLYLVGWFNCAQWDGEDYRKSQAQDLSVEEARSKFETQAAGLSSGDLRIRAVVLNTALR